MKKTILIGIIAMFALMQIALAAVITPNVIMPGTPVYEGDSFDIKLDVSSFDPITNHPTPYTVNYNLTENADFSSFTNISGGSLTMPASGTAFANTEYLGTFTATDAGNYNISAQVWTATQSFTVSKNITILGAIGNLVLTLSSAPSDVPVNDLFNITVTVTNTGAGTANDVYLRLNHDSGLTTILSPSIIPVSFGNMASGSSQQRTFIMNSTVMGTHTYVFSANSTNILVQDSESVDVIIGTELIIPSGVIDNDGDGWDSTVDCNDNDPLIGNIHSYSTGNIGCEQCDIMTCGATVNTYSCSKWNAACTGGPGGSSGSQYTPQVQDIVIDYPGSSYIVDLIRFTTSTHAYFVYETIYIHFEGQEVIGKVLAINENYIRLSLTGNHINENLFIDIGKSVQFDVTGDREKDIEIIVESVDLSKRDNTVTLTIRRAKQEQKPAEKVVTAVSNTLSGMVNVVEESFKERPNLMIGMSISIITAIAGILLYLFFFKPW